MGLGELKKGYPGRQLLNGSVYHHRRQFQLLVGSRNELYRDALTC